MDEQTHTEKRTVQPHKQQMLNRLKRIEGQVRGVHNMVEDDRYCVDILNQIAAIQSAVNKVSVQLMEDHTHHCVSNAIESGEGEESINELMDVMKRMMK
ncbi:metal-sensitive transcriptional regulator [Salibacterium halotolerans]|uniref:DNA-binding transcriptional regulator, FrmR family n=1 Tax=Salibacterium halotolerans TaxID=1884432 RepID=A0A1I5V7M1_9BACI|nr:metal-sensitive transcriptional regulator [Salibacterium halotolerans]SFQ03402.1 DNA-binding transcriptional regulator, FrmR family [Salibacterium halotolerans]